MNCYSNEMLDFSFAIEIDYLTRILKSLLKGDVKNSSEE